MMRSHVVRMRATGVGHMTRRDVERVRDETLGIGPGSSGRRDGVGTGHGTSHNSYQLSTHFKYTVWNFGCPGSFIWAQVGNMVMNLGLHDAAWHGELILILGG